MNLSIIYGCDLSLCSRSPLRCRASRVPGGETLKNSRCVSSDHPEMKSLKLPFRVEAFPLKAKFPLGRELVLPRERDDEAKIKRGAS